MVQYSVKAQYCFNSNEKVIPLQRLALILWSITASASLAADWPHVRGPAYDAHSRETGLVDDWPSAGPPVLWTRELGPGYSSLVVADGRAFTLYQTTAGMYLIA